MTTLNDLPGVHRGHALFSKGLEQQFDMVKGMYSLAMMSSLDDSNAAKAYGMILVSACFELIAATILLTYSGKAVDELRDIIIKQFPAGLESALQAEREKMGMQKDTLQ